MNENQSEAAFLDIETTGLSCKSKITTVALLYRDQVRFFVNGINLKDLPSALSPIKRLVTFNGTRFDLPFLQLKSGISLNLEHVDLKTLCRKKGLTGGLKRIGYELRIERREQCRSGKEAVLYWKCYVEKRDWELLKELLVYNGNDVLVLRQVLLFLAGEEYGKIVSAEAFAHSFIEDYIGVING